MNAFLAWLGELGGRLKRWIVVAPWERGVLVRLGRNARTLEPGPHFRIPLLDDVRIVNTRLRIAACPVSSATTADGRGYSIGLSIAFHIADPLKAMEKLAHPEACIAAAAWTAVPGYVGGVQSRDLRLDRLEAEVTAKVQELAAGISIDFVRATDFALARTIRLPNSDWRLSTNYDHEPGR